MSVTLIKNGAHIATLTFSILFRYIHRITSRPVE